MGKTAWKCVDCYFITVAPGPPLFKCECGEEFNANESSGNVCPNCNRICTPVFDYSCPDCQTGELQELAEFLECDFCTQAGTAHNALILFDSKEGLRDHLSELHSYELADFYLERGENA